MQQYICIYIYWILYVHINIYIKAYICIYRQTNHTPHPKPLQQHDYSIPPPILSRHDILHLFLLLQTVKRKRSRRPRVRLCLFRTTNLWPSPSPHNASPNRTFTPSSIFTPFFRCWDSAPSIYHPQHYNYKSLNFT